jgi:TonB-dependent starch-binding outer membrane protein SusC
MKKIRKLKARMNFSDLKGLALKKKFRMVRFTVFCFFLSLIQVMAVDSYSQMTKLSLNASNKPLENVLATIEDESEFFFLYNKDLIDVEQKVNINAENETIKLILDDLLKGKDISYTVYDRQIVLFNSDVISKMIAQQKAITGKVTDENGQALPGVTVVIKGTTQGTVTNTDGNYSISNIPENTILIFSFVGMITQEILVSDQTTINITMEVDAIGIDEVVAIGYGTMKKSDLTGSVSSISSDDFKLTPLKSISSMLQGSVAGVEVVKGNSAPGGGSIVRIRGGNSMNGSSNPLYIVDGFPGGSVGNSNDIESIQILKDASATAIYGSRGANGVIIITTKRGTGGPTFTVDVYHGIQQVRKKIDMLNGKEYAEFANEKAENEGRSPYYPDVNNLPGNTDWQDEILQLAPLSKYYVSVIGGNSDNKYAISGNYSKQEGIIKNSDSSGGHIRTNLDNKVTNWFRISTSITASHGVTNRSYVKTNSQGIIYRALQAPPIAPVYDENGNYFPIRELASADNLWDNPMALLNGTLDRNVSNNFNANSNLEFDILDGLKVSVRLGAKYSNSRNDYYLERIMLEGGNGGKATISESDSYRYLFENIISYKKLFKDKHDLNITAGYSWENNIYSRFEATTWDFLNDNLHTDNLSSGSTIKTPQSYKSENSILSWIGRVNYVLNNKYLFTVTTRADGSSRLGANSKWGIFPSGAIGWRVSEEGFMKSLQFISNLKLRASYGTTGNQEIGNYLSLSRLSSVAAIQGVNEDRVIGFVPVVLQNPELKWEVTNQVDLGFDLGLFDQKIDLTFDYYHKNTSDLLATVPLSLSSGYSSIIKNFGDMKNEGFEIALNYNIFDNKDLSWSVGANFSLNRNEVLKVATETGQFFTGTLSSPIDSYVNIIKEGSPLSSMYGYLEDGLWESDQTTGSIQPTAKAGDQKYVDVNEDGSFNEADKVILGSPYPDFIYGLNTNFTYKNFSLNVLIQGVQGGLIFNANKFSTGDSFARNGNQLAEVKDHWSKENPDPNAKYPRMSNVSPLISERYFEDASYLRFKTISLAYNLPTQEISWLKDAMIYISGENLFTITDYSGYDPEVSSTSGSSLFKGIDIGAYPSAKTISVGIIVNL